jgi:hypothetical protein
VETGVFIRNKNRVHPIFGGVRIVFWCWGFVLFVFVLCLVCPMLPVSLDCSFLMTPLVFSNVYLKGFIKQDKKKELI